MCQCVRLWFLLQVEDDLYDSLSVAQVYKDQAPRVSPPVNLPHKHNILTGMSGPEAATIIKPLLFK